MSKKYTIQVRCYQRDEHGNRTIYEVVETIERSLRAEQIGNFNPFFCTYRGDDRCLVKSDAGDVSDPFRRGESYAETFYIEIGADKIKTPTRFKLDLNLDDESEVEGFIEKYGTSKGRLLAAALGLSGKGSSKLADRLSGYAWNKQTAIRLRRKGEIATAQTYETICDTIYQRDIQPACECW